MRNRGPSAAKAGITCPGRASGDHRVGKSPGGSQTGIGQVSRPGAAGGEETAAMVRRDWAHGLALLESDNAMVGPSPATAGSSRRKQEPSPHSWYDVGRAAVAGTASVTR